MEQKILSPEYALNMYLDKLMILEPSELEYVNAHNYFDSDSPCQLYFICRRPRVTVDPGSFRAHYDRMELTFNIHDRENKKRFPFAFENPFYSNALSIESYHPYTTFSIKKNDDPLITVRSSAFLQSFPREVANTHFLDLEVLYIGQTLGVDGGDTTPKMLKNHKTLQGIYATAVQKNPESEICLLLASFLQHNAITAPDTPKFTREERSPETDQPATSGVLNNDAISNQQMINITEAALIRYFQPVYNTEYKDVFPNPAQATYRGCHNLNIYSVGIELDTYGVANCHIYSQKVEAKWLHMKTYVFHSPDERKELFSMLHPAVEA